MKASSVQAHAFQVGQDTVAVSPVPGERTAFAVTPPANVRTRVGVILPTVPVPAGLASLGGRVVYHASGRVFDYEMIRVRSRVVPGTCAPTLCPLGKALYTTFLTPPRCKWVPNFGRGKSHRGHLVAPNGSRTDPCDCSTKNMTYGQDCAMRCDCSVHASGCHQLTGQCVCVDGWRVSTESAKSVPSLVTEYG
ncbi:Multiple epidermal growth factor-like domains protein 10 [Branchiostoma belcheri]|nr:Multiple epidermal growth factor-like domains protein 10 [Branchiostoma belcheri]